MMAYLSLKFTDCVDVLELCAVAPFVATILFLFENTIVDFFNKSIGRIDAFEAE